MIRGIEARLKKLEAARPRRVSIFIVWGETEEAAEGLLLRLRAAGAVRPRDNTAALAWPGSGTMPASRRTDVEDLSQRELELLSAYHQAEAARLERERAIDAGEDIAGLDQTDFYIRFLRRFAHHDELRMLGHARVPSPAFHGIPCRVEQLSAKVCESCARGETTPEGHAAWRQRYKAWMTRYMPGEERQKAVSDGRVWVASDWES
jgi:hypothetical protein